MGRLGEINNTEAEGKLPVPFLTGLHLKSAWSSRLLESNTCGEAGQQVGARAEEPMRWPSCGVRLVGKGRRGRNDLQRGHGGLMWPSSSRGKDSGQQKK